MVSIFDTHAHYDSKQYKEDMDEVLTKIHTTDEKVPGVGCVVNTGADIDSSRKSLELAGRYDFVYAAVGVHPDSAGELVFCEKKETAEENTDHEPEERKYIPEEICNKNMKALKEMCEDTKTVAVGEIGLDYHWDIWPRAIQKEAFCRQWELAIEKDLPVVIHSRDAAEDTLNIVKEFYKKNGHKSLKADMHCYSYSIEHAEEYLKMGLMFGIGGVVTFKNSKKLKEVVDLLPLERILLETDAPYMAPDPFRGKRNDSGLLRLVADKIAEIKGIDVKHVYEQTWENATRFFARYGQGKQ